MITLFCVKASESSNSDNFYLTGVSKHFFILSPRKFYLFLYLKNIPHKKSIKLERLLCKGKSSQKYHKCYSWLDSWLAIVITLVKVCAKRVSFYQGCNGPVKNKGKPTIPTTVRFSCLNKNT